MEPRKRSLTEQRRRSSGACPTMSSPQSCQLTYTGMEPTVHLLNYQLYVAGFPKDGLSSATHSLLQIMLKLFQEDADCRRNHFFSFTETSSEYSVVLDHDLVEILRPAISSSQIKLTESKWRALVVEVGALGSLTGISSIVASVIAPLADCGVSVFCLSTNLDDFVLVKEHALEKALTCLSRSFQLKCDSEHKQDLALVQSVVGRCVTVESPKKRTKHSVPPSCGVDPRPITHPYFCSSSRYSICGIVPKALPSIGTSLLQLMLFNHRSSSDETFLSFTIVENDISIVLDCRDISRFPEDSLYLNKETWRMIRIGEGPLGFDECGIVAQVSAPLAKATISTYYICTYNTDYTLVCEENVERALKVLNDRYVSKLIKKMCTKTLTNLTNAQSPLAESSLSSTSLAEAGLEFSTNLTNGQSPLAESSLSSTSLADAGLDFSTTTVPTLPSSAAALPLPLHSSSLYTPTALQGTG